MCVCVKEVLIFEVLAYQYLLLLDEIPERDIVIWNLMIEGYICIVLCGTCVLVGMHGMAG